MRLIQELWLLFDIKSKHQLFVLFCVMVITATLEVAGVASIMPFMMAIKNPELLQQNKILFFIGEVSSLSAHFSLVALAGICTLVLLVLTNIAWLASNWLMLRFAHGQVQKISLHLLKHYLRQPYEFFIERNSSDLSKNVLTEVNRLTTSVVIPTLQLASKSLVVCCLTGLLLYINTKITLVVLILIGGVYASLYLLLRKRLMSYGKLLATAETQRFQATSEAFGSIKELKLLRRETYFEERFSLAAARHSSIYTKAEAYAILPRYLLEMVAFGGMITLSLYLMTRQGQANAALPLIALFAFVGYRAMPAIQQIYYCLVKIRYNHAILTTIVMELNTDNIRLNTADFSPHLPKLQLKEKLELHDICYNYPNSRDILHHVCLSVKANTTCGIAGASGAGKTTLIDIVLGLLNPSSGLLKIDGEQVNHENLSKWQACIGYVPQSIYLIDDTIAGNIAFGIPAHERLQEKIEVAAKRAHLHEFILSLPEGYQSIVGERGVKLSGGQRQRIGIARALYHEPQVLVLDEATSALDVTTENAVMDAIAEMSGRITILIIAHRLSTLRQCAQIILMDAGRVVDSGSYTDLTERNTLFQSYISANKKREKPPENIS